MSAESRLPDEVAVRVALAESEVRYETSMNLSAVPFDRGFVLITN